MPYLTGNAPTPPTDYICRRLFIPNDPALVGAVNGALLELTRVRNWETFGTQSPDDATAQMAIMFDEYLESSACMIGIVVPYATAAPPSGVLPCDGTIYARADYPRLYDALGAIFHVDSENFYTPDLRGRLVLASGAGSGLTSRTLGDVGGEETHVLTPGELAAHAHTSPPHDHVYSQPTFGIDVESVGVPDPTGVGNPPVAMSTSAVAVTIDSTGGDEPHENMPPFLVLHYGIIAR